MFDFIYSEVWWMETIIATIVTAGVTILGFFAFYNNSITSIGKDIKNFNDKGEKNKELLIKDHNGLTKDHEGLAKGHEGLAKDHTDLKSSILNVKNDIVELKHFIELEQVKKSVLAGKEIDINNTMLHLNSMIELLAQQKIDISNLIDKNQILHNENQQLKNQLQRTTEVNRQTYQQDQDEEFER